MMGIHNKPIIISVHISIPSIYSPSTGYWRSIDRPLGQQLCPRPPFPTRPVTPSMTQSHAHDHRCTHSSRVFLHPVDRFLSSVGHKLCVRRHLSTHEVLQPRCDITSNISRASCAARTNPNGRIPSGTDSMLTSAIFLGSLIMVTSLFVYVNKETHYSLG